MTITIGKVSITVVGDIDVKIDGNNVTVKQKEATYKYIPPSYPMLPSPLYPTTPTVPYPTQPRITLRTTISGSSSTLETAEGSYDVKE